LRINVDSTLLPVTACLKDWHCSGHASYPHDLYKYIHLALMDPPPRRPGTVVVGPAVC
jgi:hypothetical protein